MSSQMSEMYTPIANLATNVKNQDNSLKRLMSQQMVENSDADKLFGSSDG